MKVDYSKAGVVKLILEDAEEWRFLQDMLVDSDGDLAGDLGELMRDEDDFWEEIVVPELADFFAAQRQHVREVIAAAHRAAVDGLGEFLITKDSVEDWYGVMNQAQLELEKKYEFGARHLVKFTELEAEAMQSFARQRMYSSIQQLLLETLME